MGRPQNEALRNITERERQELERVVKATSERVDRMKRAKSLLAVAAGVTWTEAGKQAGISRQAVGKLVKRFNAHGRAALSIAQGRGRRATYRSEARQRIRQELHREPAREEDATATWSLLTLQRVLRRSGLPRVGATTIRRILHEAGYTFGHTRTWCPTGDQTEHLKYAIACYQEALHYETPEIAPYAYAGTQNNLGTAYLALPTAREADLARAAVCFQKALTIYTLEVTPHEYRLTNRNLGNLYFNQRNWASALVAYRAAMEAGQQLYRAGMSTESKATEVAENAVLYRNAAYAVAQLGNSAEALLILERGKTRLLIEALHLQIPRPVSVPDAVWAAFLQAGAAVRTAQSTSVITLDEKENLIQAYKTRERTSRAANAALDFSIECIREYAPDFLREISLSTILALLPDEHTGLVAFCCTELGSMGLVVCRNHNQPVQMVDIPGFTQTALRRLLIDRDANGNSIGGWLASYQHYLLERSESAFDTWRTVMMHTLREIGQHLLTPILAALPSDVEQLVFLPSGELFLFPLHAVPLSDNTSDLVCDHYQVTYAPSIEVLINSRAKTIREREHSLYAVINPTADLILTLIEGAAIAQLFTGCRVDEGTRACWSKGEDLCAFRLSRQLRLGKPVCIRLRSG